MSIDENGAFDDSRLLDPFELVHQILPNLMPLPAPLKKEGGRTSATMVYYEKLSAAVLSQIKDLSNLGSNFFV